MPADQRAIVVRGTSRALSARWSPITPTAPMHGSDSESELPSSKVDIERQTIETEAWNLLDDDDRWEIIKSKVPDIARDAASGTKY